MGHRMLCEKAIGPTFDTRTLAERVTTDDAARAVIFSKKYTDKQKADWVCGVFGAVPAKVARKKLGWDWIKQVGAHNALKIGRYVVCDRVPFEDAGGAVWSKTQMRKVIPAKPGTTVDDLARAHEQWRAAEEEAAAKRRAILASMVG